MKIFYNQDYNDITMSCHSNKMTALPILIETWRHDTMNNKRLSLVNTKFRQKLANCSHFVY